MCKKFILHFVLIQKDWRTLSGNTSRIEGGRNKALFPADDKGRFFIVLNTFIRA